MGTVGTVALAAAAVAVSAACAAAIASGLAALGIAVVPAGAAGEGLQAFTAGAGRLIAISQVNVRRMGCPPAARGTAAESRPPDGYESVSSARSMKRNVSSVIRSSSQSSNTTWLDCSIQ